MWKRTMLAVGLAGVLAVPAGVALAATDDPVNDADRNRVTTQMRDQARDQARTRDRLRVQDPATCDGTGPMSTGYHHGGSGSGASGAGYGQGAMDGTGPIHTQPADGSGFRHGAGGR